jgi:cystathionine gamma-synthase
MSDFPPSRTTRAVRAAIATDREHGAVVPPIHLTSTFAFETFDRPRTFDYTRTGNPTRAQLASVLADLEGGASAVVTSTGMSAVLLVLQLLRPGDVLLAAHDCYGGTQRLLRGLSKRGHFDVVFADLTAPDAPLLAGAHQPRMVWIETPSNPLLRITDIRRLAASARAARAIVVVDNTFLSPVLQQPIELGADVVVHSTTKYLNGHSDVVGGAVVAADQPVGDELAWWGNCLGVTGAPFDSWLTLRGIRTLHARMRDHLAGAASIVDALRVHPAVTRVYYPGLPDHPGHDIARSQQAGFGAMVSFEVGGGAPSVERLTARLRHFTLAESLGGVESLVAHPATMTHASMDPEARAAAGIGDALVRLSVGIESPEDLVRDLTGALDALTRVDERNSRPRRARSASAASDHADVVLLGAGAVGREVARQLGRGGDDGPPLLRVAGWIDRSGLVVAEGGFDPGQLAELCALKAAGRPFATQPGGRAAAPLHALGEIAGNGLHRPILVDVTAADTTDVLLGALIDGFDLVLANKVPLTREQSTVDLLHRTARDCGKRLRYEATVGAGLPVIDTLQKLLETGDEVRAIEGCPSGTLGFVFGELSRGVSFTQALHRAVTLGYTEPDPRVDLSGLDVARKALILARAVGFRGELSDVRIESLVPAELSTGTCESFLTGAAGMDAAWAERVHDARARGEVWRYRVRATPSSVAAGLVAVPATDPLAALHGTDNRFAFTTARYCAQPLVITGPGAGPAVTASGIISDLLSLVHSRANRPGPLVPARR